MQRMTFTQNENNELKRFLAAKQATGRKAVFVKWAVYQAERGQSVLLCHYDRVMGMYRNWLCFNQF